MRIFWITSFYYHCVVCSGEKLSLYRIKNSLLFNLSKVIYNIRLRFCQFLAVSFILSSVIIYWPWSLSWLFIGSYIFIIHCSSSLYFSLIFWNCFVLGSDLCIIDVIVWLQWDSSLPVSLVNMFLAKTFFARINLCVKLYASLLLAHHLSLVLYLHMFQFLSFACRYVLLLLLHDESFANRVQLGILVPLNIYLINSLLWSWRHQFRLGCFDGYAFSNCCPICLAFYFLFWLFWLLCYQMNACQCIEFKFPIFIFKLPQSN